MASISAFSPPRPCSHSSLSSTALSALTPLQIQFPFKTQFKRSGISSIVYVNKLGYSRSLIVQAMAEEEEALVADREALSPDDVAAVEQTVSVAMSPSDVLSMFFLGFFYLLLVLPAKCLLKCLSEFLFGMCRQKERCLTQLFLQLPKLWRVVAYIPLTVLAVPASILINQRRISKNFTMAKNF